MWTISALDTRGTSATRQGEMSRPGAGESAEKAAKTQLSSHTSRCTTAPSTPSRPTRIRPKTRLGDKLATRFRETRVRDLAGFLVGPPGFESRSPNRRKSRKPRSWRLTGSRGGGRSGNFVPRSHQGPTTPGPCIAPAREARQASVKRFGSPSRTGGGRGAAGGPDRRVGTRVLEIWRSPDPGELALGRGGRRVVAAGGAESLELH